MNEQQWLDWIEENLKKADVHGPLGKYTADIVLATQLSDLISRLPEEKELPVIPQFVADWIEYQKTNRNPLLWAVSEGSKREAIADWLFPDNYREKVNREDLLLRAWLDGYTIEKVKRYRVQLPDAESNASSNLLGLMKTGDSRIVICKIKFNTFLYSDNVRLTEQEIKRNHEYLWAFAEEVPNV